MKQTTCFDFMGHGALYSHHPPPAAPCPGDDSAAKTTTKKHFLVLMLRNIGKFRGRGSFKIWPR